MRPLARACLCLTSVVVAGLTRPGLADIVIDDSTSCVRTRIAIINSADPPTVKEDCPTSRSIVSYDSPDVRQEIEGAFADATQTTRLTLSNPRTLRFNSSAFAGGSKSATRSGGGESSFFFAFTLDGAASFDVGGSGSFVANVRLFPTAQPNTSIFFCNNASCPEKAGTLAPGQYRFEAKAQGGGDGIFRSYGAGLSLDALATPSPTPSATPNGEVTWINPAGGAFGEPANWNPPRVPVVDDQHEDTAVFTLANTYAVNVAGAHTKRMVIRNSSIDLVGGTTELTANALAEPSLVVGQNGKLHLVSGTLTSVHSVLGDVSGGLAEVDLVSGTPTWTNTGRLTIGDAGSGRLTVVAGSVASAESRIGGGLLGAGEAIVGGPGTWTTGNLGLGFGGGTARLEIRDAGVVNSGDAFVGIAGVPSDQPTFVEMHDADSTWTLSGTLTVGAGTDVSGGVDVANGADLVCDALTIAGESPSVTIRGLGSTASITDTVRVGANGGDPNVLTGLFFVSDGAAVLGKTLRTIGNGVAQIETGAVADFDVVDVTDGKLGVLGKDADGHPAKLTSFAETIVAGKLEVGADGALKAQSLAIGDEVGTGEVLLEPGASGSATLDVTLGVLIDDGALDVQGGGAVTVGGDVGIGLRGNGFPDDGANIVNVFGDGAGRPASLTVTGGIAVGVGKPGELVVGRKGDLVTAAQLDVGAGSASTGKLFVQDGARLECSGNAHIGDLGPGTAFLNGEDVRDPVLHVGGTLDVGGDAAGRMELTRGVLEVGGTTTVHAHGAIVGSGRVSAAVLVDPGGCFAVSSTASASAGCGVAAGSPLRVPSSGLRRAAVRAARAVADPTLLVDGNLVVASGATLRIEIGGPGGGLHVTGDATLNGRVEIAFVGGFVPRDGDEFTVLDVAGTRGGSLDDAIVTGLPPGWKVEPTLAGGTLAFTVFGDYLCYRTAAAKGAKFAKGLAAVLPTALGPLAFAIDHPLLLCNPSGPSTGSQQGADTQLRGYAVADVDGDPLAIARRTLRVTNGLFPAGELVVETATPTLVLVPAAECVDAPAGTCSADLAAPTDRASFACAAAKTSKSGAKFPKTLVASAVDAFGEPRTYEIARPSHVCAPTTADLGDALACYVAKPLGKSCALDAPTNAAGRCKTESDCGGTKKLTRLCAKQTKHARRGALVFATTLARDRAGTVKPLELCVPSRLSAP